MAARFQVFFSFLIPSGLTHSPSVEAAIAHDCCSVAQSVWLFGTPWLHARLGFPVLHYLPEFAQTHVHWVSDAIQPSHPLPSTFFSCPPSFPASDIRHLLIRQEVFHFSPGIHIETPVNPNVIDSGKRNCAKPSLLEGLGAKGGGREESRIKVRFEPRETDYITSILSNSSI